MHDYTSQDIFDNLQASASSDIFVESEDDSIFVRSASDHSIDSIEDSRSLPSYSEYSQLPQGTLARDTSTMLAGLVGYLPPPVGFSRTNRKSIPMN
jgi:hypothetical protein